MDLEEKLTRVRFRVDLTPHIKIDKDLCRTCPDQPCLYVCPVKNYVLKQGEIVFSWQGCLECGACRIVCVNKAIEWSYPRGGYGVSWRYG
ncbi:MAG: 4Fe-4S dicluster domain-containing protein [Deltaproteobacteria bacterium]|nr:4Fe-4S dicluster domain-containing protein [Deltaproteobacteria bacterium]